MWIYFQQPTMITESSHPHSVYLERGGTILTCARATVSHTLACDDRASCPVGLSQPPIKTLLHNPSLLVTRYYVVLWKNVFCCLYLDSPRWSLPMTSTLNIASRVHVHTALSIHAHTHCGIQFPVCHTRQHVCFYLNHVLPFRVWFSTGLNLWHTHMAVGLLSNEWNKKKTSVSPAGLHPELNCRTNKTSTESKGKNWT